LILWSTCALSIALLMIACSGFGVYVSNHWTITQTISGPQAARLWRSVQNGVGDLSGIVAPWLTGVVGGTDWLIPPYSSPPEWLRAWMP
jgi:hypothetical protein